MSKRKSKRGKGELQAKLPKRVGGVKIPKELRRQGEMLIDRARDAVSLEVLASGAAMAATALIGRGRTGDAPHAPAPAPPPPGQTSIDYEEIGKAAGAVVITAATALIAALVSGRRGAGSRDGDAVEADAGTP